MAESLKSKSIKGVAWTFVESASLKIIQFVLGVIMARLLMPEDYGIIAIIFVFILKSASNLNGNLNGSKELEHYAS